MKRADVDVLIIGAGTAGLSAERTARRSGARTLLVDDSFAGTTCATVGCMPSKLLIAAADAAEAVRRSSTFGINAEMVIDGVAVMTRVRHERDRFAAATRQEIERLPGDVRRTARACFVDQTTLSLSDGNIVSAKAVVVATGSSPAIPDAFAELGDRILTNETLFELRTLPGSLAVIGSGPLGLELAQAMARLGVRVSMFDQKPGLSVPDKAVANALLAILERDMTVHLGVEIEPSLTQDGIRLLWSGVSSGDEIFDHVLVAAGRPPNLEALNLEATGIEMRDSRVPVDPETLQYGSLPIFFAGDAAAGRPVLHEASAEGAIAGRNAAAFPKTSPVRRTTPFSIMFTAPPLAIIGDVEREDAVIGTMSYTDQGRARVMDEAEGHVRLHADPRDGRLLGAVMLGPEIDQSAHPICWAIEWGKSASDLLAMPFYHPTLVEGFKTALREICAAVSAPVPGERDDGSPSGA